MRQLISVKWFLPIVLTLLCPWLMPAGGCTGRAATRDEVSAEQALDRALTEDAQSREERERRIQDLMTRALTAPNISERAAAILATSDDAAGNLTRTLVAIEQAISVVAANLANCSTTGYKRLRPVFRGGGRELALLRDFSQGDLENTGRSLDVAIRGRGFFAVSIWADIGEGTAYTRDGTLMVDADGRLVLYRDVAFALDPPITVPTDYLTVDIQPAGRVSVTTPGSAIPMEVGVIRLAAFTNPEGLEDFGDSFFLQTAASGDPTVSDPGSDGAGLLRAGCLEQSNVDTVVELVRLATLQNWFKAIAKMTEDALDMRESAGRSADRAASSAPLPPDRRE